MKDINNWRGYDLRDRKRKIEKTFNLEQVRKPEDVPVIIGTPTYFCFGSKDKPADYFSDPATMVAYQEEAYQLHLEYVNDDFVPYFMPWFGTGVLAAAFGCGYTFDLKPGEDPMVVSTCIERPADISKLTEPDIATNTVLQKVLGCMEYAAKHSDLPIGLTDINSPLSTANQMCGSTNLFTWMYEEPNAVHDLMDLVTDALIEWVKMQKSVIGEPLDKSNGLQGVWTPKGGVWLSDDDMTFVGPELYEEFIVPKYRKIYDTFGGGHLHFCGDGGHQVPNIKKINSLTAINNSPLYNFNAFEELFTEINNSIVVELQDAAPIDPDYYAVLFSRMKDPRGVIVATFVEDEIGMNSTGAAVPVQWDRFEQANQIVRSVRNSVAKNLSV
jgi:hypothetical protein